MFDNEVVSISAQPVRDKMEFESVTFGIHQPSQSMYAEIRCSATSESDPEIGQEDVRLRLYEGAMQFLTDFRADPKAAVKVWIQAQTDEPAP